MPSPRTTINRSPVGAADVDQAAQASGGDAGRPGRAATGPDPARASSASNAPRALETLPRGPLGWQIFALALPMLGEQFFNSLVGMVDTWLAGQISKEAVAAVGTAAYMSWFINLGFTLVGVGAAAVVSRAAGAGDRATAILSLNQSIIMAVLIGAVMSVAAYTAAGPVAALLTRTPDATAMCVHYLRVDALGYSLASLTAVGTAVLRASGNARTPMLIMIGINVVNTGLSAALVFGWFGASLGVTGIVIGTVVARCIGGLATLAILLRGQRGLQLNRSALRPDLAAAWRMLRIGLPSAGEAAIMALAQMSFIAIIAHSASGAAGTANYAAHMIAMRVESLSYLPAFAWGTAAATVVGQYLGAGRPRAAARAGHLAALQGLCLTSVAGVLFFCCAAPIFALMTHEADVHAVGVPAFRIMAFAQPFIAVAIIYMNALRGAGDTRWPLLFSIFGGIGLRVPIAYIGAIVLHGGLIGAWCGMWADNVGRAAMGCGRFAHGGWQRVRV